MVLGPQLRSLDPWGLMFLVAVMKWKRVCAVMSRQKENYLASVFLPLLLFPKSNRIARHAFVECVW